MMNFGYTDTYGDLQGFANVPVVDLETDFAVSMDTGTEKRLTNITTPVDQTETVRIAITDVANVYSGSNIQPSLQSPVKKGKSIVVSLQETGRVSNGDGTVTDYPIQCHFVLKFPVSANFDADDAKHTIERMTALIYDKFMEQTGVRGAVFATDARLNHWLRGALSTEATVIEEQTT